MVSHSYWETVLKVKATTSISDCSISRDQLRSISCSSRLCFDPLSTRGVDSASFPPGKSIGPHYRFGFGAPPQLPIMTTGTNLLYSELGAIKPGLISLNGTWARPAFCHPASSGRRGRFLLVAAIFLVLRLPPQRRAQSLPWMDWALHRRRLVRRRGHPYFQRGHWYVRRLQPRSSPSRLASPRLSSFTGVNLRRAPSPSPSLASSFCVLSSAPPLATSLHPQPYRNLPRPCHRCALSRSAPSVMSSRGWRPRASPGSLRSPPAI
jgi:hypothetical protein